MSEETDLCGSVVLITGGGKRLGRAFAEALVRRGASLAVHYGTSAKGAEEVVELARSLDIEAVALQADLADAEQAAGLIQRAETALGLATLSSFVGGMMGGVVLVGFAPQLARVALKFQSPETFSLVFLALVAVATVDRGSLTKALAATVIGLMFSTVVSSNRKLA